MSEFVTDLFEDSYPEDESPDLKYWTCAKCRGDFIDPDDNPTVSLGQANVETKDHWLGITSPICSSCAARSGIPSIDEEYDANV